MFRFTSLLAVALVAVSTTTAFAPTTTFHQQSAKTRWVSRTTPTPSSLKMAIDYNDPVVAEEFAKVQPMSFEDVEEELQAKGIPVPATMK